MPRAKATARASGRTREETEDEHVDDSSISSESEAEDSETDDTSDSDNDKPAEDFTKVLNGAPGIKPLRKNSKGEVQAVQLGYSSKLVSKWYHHECEYNSCPERWAEFDNVDDEETDLRARTSAIPIIHRHHYVNKHWVTQSITIQDSAMRDVLRVVLAKYQDLDLDLASWTFAPPFMPLVHRWEDLKTHFSALPAGPQKNAAIALIAFLAPIVASSVLSLAQTKHTGKVSFENVWQIFPPSSVVKTKFYGIDTVCRVVKYKKRPADRCNPEGWVIDMEYVDWNGESSGWTTTSLTIWKFDGFKKVTGLPVFPISFSPDAAKIKDEMISRGRKWAGLRGYHFKTADGTKILLETEERQQRPVFGKVCVDAYAYYRSCNIVKPSLRPVSAAKQDEDEEDGVDESESLDADGYKTNFSVAQVETRSKAKGPAERAEDLSPLTDDELLMTTPWVKAFDLKSKDFCELCVSDIKDMVWNDEAFEKLVLPGGEKELAWTFVENKSQSNSEFDDFVPDKGRGLIILMFGPPGVGKTFTAEAVAERSRVPLYSMSAGDLGTKPSEVEDALERALELCRMWNAMLLLDEADVFLGERTNESLARNELVSIFLTKLEYYQGILFLTTNRISSIDHAFQSRVDLFLPYRNLTSEARRQVWNNFIDRAGRDKFDVDDKALDQLSELKLNGREIKNLIKSAQLLSLKSCGKVPMDRLLLLADKRVQALSELDGNGK
ncbi:P-loop containing nucleoside triphosphate hydrolase protein [Dactylonectria macrodidyma]|uniref:P-loop containing nucleoside triphosphate hydrolase protein n=1 Tax=Dactylonectria macrodidyma TaxID=307937 RepID=A0A9P9IM77_9HYPO|nr:P-loop containing nucleoside triphosphate hydrolase protein [Dactylonectria macrodidyma]